MRIRDALGITEGITAVIGSGGKTTLLHVLADELPGRILLCTTTRMYPSDTYKTLRDPTPERVREDWARVLCVGSPAEKGKIGPCRSLSLEEMIKLAPYVLVEADGSRGLPLKAHAPWEPVLPAGASQVICVVGASGFGAPPDQAVHRPELWTAPDTSPASVAEMLLREGGWNRVLVNQCDTPDRLELARKLAERLPAGTVCAGSLEKREMVCLQ